MPVKELRSLTHLSQKRSLFIFTYRSTAAHPSSRGGQVPEGELRPFLRKMYAIIYPISLIFMLLACKATKETPSSPLFSGQWKAQWDTDPANFPDISTRSIFTMDGSFTFTGKNDVTVEAYGFPGCIFSSDTLTHTLKWKLSNDTLSLVNEGDMYGINYGIKEMSDDKIRLQLMDDIFITLIR